MLLTITGKPIVILKAAPTDGKALRESHVDITPGYHTNKQHWIKVSGKCGSGSGALCCEGDPRSGFGCGGAAGFVEHGACAC